MGYLHINNLYKDTTVLLFKELYALEKVHGTSAHVTFFSPKSQDAALNWVYKPREIRFFSGGESHDRFVKLFDAELLLAKFHALTIPVDKDITIYGEAYGGSQQGMSHTYGKQLKFIAFDVQIGDCWLDVPNALSIVKSLGMEFVPWVKTTSDLPALDSLRDAPSRVAIDNGVSTVVVINERGDIRLDNPRPREGIVLRPLYEMTLNNGNRVIAKHKGAAFSETASARHVEVDPLKLAQLDEAATVANEWVTPMRLHHVLDKIPDHDMSKMPVILKAMVEDVTREGAGEIDWSKDEKGIRKAITRRTSELYKVFLNARLRASVQPIAEAA